EAQAAGDVLLERERVDEAGRERRGRAADGAPARAHDDRLADPEAGGAVAHGDPGREAALQYDRRLHAEEGRAPQHDVRHLARLHAADVAVDAEGTGGVDGVFRDVALRALVVGARRLLFGQAAALVLHLAGELPAARDHLVDAAHALAVGAHHGD